MLNLIWCFMILLSILCGIATGRAGEVGLAAVNSAKEAVELGVSMLGVIALWTGVMKTAEKSGLTAFFLRHFRPILRFLFPELRPDGEAAKYIAQNFLANFLGLGWAATPFGLKAMQELKKLGGESDRASDSMCNFLILNIASIQLIPVNVIAYRSRYGSVNPAAIVAPALLATLSTTLAAIAFLQLKRRLK